MGDAIGENSDDEQDPIEKHLMEYQGETQLEIKDIKLEEGLPQYTTNKYLCKLTQDPQKFLVTPNKGMAYIHGTVTNMTVCVYHSQHQLIIDGGSNFSIVAKDHLKK
ncbi:hypothetical protein O181_005386 [Austropuccinia psidii MF-1]|uniref:Uncharacterized protein n=1 Tax=Austropuccinia psidii MF-1 TaxID=1389203 RepID=A0A9Q3GFV0_9BASI|nr:hypothetical protein [Austropuccinia psidii MF-1]